MAVLLAGCGSTVSGAARRARGSGAGDEFAAGGTGGASNAATGDTVANDASGFARVDGGAAQAGGSSVGRATNAKTQTAASGPIQIGIVRTGVSNAAAFGVSLGNTVTESDVDA